jgi:hypothetical protein
MTLVRGIAHAPTAADKEILQKLQVRVASVTPEHQTFEQWCDRADKLIFPETILNSGPDLWPEHESAKINGRQHVSGGLPTPYVTVPAAMQAVEPTENMKAVDTTPEARDAASNLERVYVAWKREENFDLKWHKAITTKELYGRTAARVYWDDKEGRACIEVIHQPRNLFLGYKTDSYEEVEWAAYRLYYEPNALIEEFGVEVQPFKTEDGTMIPMVMQRDWDENPTRPYLAMGDAKVEVWDYWYRQPVWKGQKFLRMDTMNVVVAGNLVVRGPIAYKEYEGRLPYVPLMNDFIPGLPTGRPALYDIEPLLREKLERITSGAQMIANGTGGDAYQLTGPDAPLRVPDGLKPVKNGIVAPGPGNRIEVIQPFIAQFQLEQFLGRIDRELAAVSGLNDLLLGLAPAQVLSSSKAINALIANFESRLSMRRRLLYKWRRDVWELSLAIMQKRMKGEKGAGIKSIMAAGGGFLDIEDPSLSPRDDMETMQRAINAVTNKLASQRTAMDWIGIDDPETEQDLIREESTDATLWPERVQLMAQLFSVLQSMGLTAPQGAQAQVAGQATTAQNDLRTALGAGANTVGSQGEGAQLSPPAIPGAPAEAQPGNAAGAPLAAPPSNQPVLQGMIENGKVKGRIMTQQKLGRR